MGNVILGLDLGTGGLRGVIVAQGRQRALAQSAFREQTPRAWSRALHEVLTKLRPFLPQVRHIIADATSSTVMLWRGHASLPPVRLYGDQGRARVSELISRLLPPESGAHGRSSTLCKVLQLKARRPADADLRIVHQIDWLNAQFLGALPDATDWNNALKLGFDPVALRWPESIRALLHPLPTPRAVMPGTPLGEIDRTMRRRWGFADGCLMHAGTTDSVAAFLASGANRPGEGVASLGSTLALKILSERPVFSPEHGVYSHRLPFGWLAGGASNCGGATLLQYFSLAEIESLSAKLEIDPPSGLDYYPLARRGERFPTDDPDMRPRIRPVPDDRARLLLGLLEGLTRVEKMGWERLRQLGAPPLTRIYCAGGGCRNAAWQKLRARRLNAPLARSRHEQAAFGVTRLLADATPAPETDSGDRAPAHPRPKR